MIFPLIVYGTVGEESPNGRRRSARQSGRCADAKFPRVAETAFWARRRCWDYGGRLSSFLAPEKLTDLRPVCSLFRKTVVYIVSWSGLKPFVTKQMEEITRLEWIIDFFPRSLLAFITLQMPLCSEQKLNGEVIKVGDRISSGVKWAPGRSLWVGFYICSTYSSQAFLVLAVCPHTRTKRKIHTHLNPSTHMLRSCTSAIHKSLDNRVRDRKETFVLFLFIETQILRAGW